MGRTAEEKQNLRNQIAQPEMQGTPFGVWYGQMLDVGEIDIKAVIWKSERFGFILSIE